MPKADYERLSKYALKENDILVTVVGTLGNAALVTKKDLPAIFSCKSTVLRPFDINPTYLLTYINSKYGKELLLRKERGAIQKGFNLGDLESLEIYVPSTNFQLEIESLFSKSLQLTKESKNLYFQAEDLLLKEIGLNNFTPSDKGINIKTLSNSFATSGRLDAEYYQPKYEDYEQLVTKLDYSFIKDEYTHISKKANKEKEGYNYVEIGNVNVGDGGNISNYVLTENLPANAKTIVKKGDILISKVRPYRGAVTIINSELDDIIVSGAFTVLRSNKESIFNNEVLKVLLRTDMYKDWLLKFNVGTSYPVIKDVDVLNMPIPIIEENKQIKIASLIQESYQLKNQSEQLLESSKQAVEIAIEQSETVALDFINNNINL